MSTPDLSAAGTAAACDAQPGSRHSDAVSLGSALCLFVFAVGCVLPFGSASAQEFLPPRLSVMKPSKALTAKVRKVLLAKKPELLRCVFTKLPRQIARVSVKANVDVTAQGVISVQPLGPPGAINDAIAVCAHDAVKELDTSVVGVAQVVISLQRPLRRVSARIDGSEGAVCRFGGYHAQSPDGPDGEDIGRFPTVRGCRPGLLCCGGGPPASGATCVRTKMCPLLP